MLNYLYKDRREKEGGTYAATEMRQAIQHCEVRKAKGQAPPSPREDSRTTLYELTIRVPKDYRVYLEGKTKFTRRVFALNRRELQNEVRAFEDEKNDELEKAIAEYKLALESSERKALLLPAGEDGYWHLDAYRSTQSAMSR